MAGFEYISLPQACRPSRANDEVQPSFFYIFFSPGDPVRFALIDVIASSALGAQRLMAKYAAVEADTVPKSSILVIVGGGARVGSKQLRVEWATEAARSKALGNQQGLEATLSRSWPCEQKIVLCC